MAAHPKPKPTRTTVHVVAHTHWDREWYHPAPRFRQRLVALIDALLDAPAEAALPFLLDGQAIVLADYLSIRKDRKATLVAHLQSGAIEAGPWFVLADNLIPSGEAIVRNLQAGRRLLGELGAQSPPVAYCPDSFGHPAALPTIAAGFGLDVGMVWRGLRGDAHPQTDTMWWEAPDGTTLLTWHFPKDGYEFGSALPIERAAAATRWLRIERDLVARAATGVVMLPNGADHHALQPELDAAIALLQDSASAAGSSVEFSRSTLSAFAGALGRAARGRTLPVVSGELRDSYGYTWTLQGTLATRAADKRENARIERLLVHDVEPWCALALLSKAPDEQQVFDGRMRAAQLAPLLHHAWETLLRTHPHDTLCGCSVDDVALAMRARQHSAKVQAMGLREDAIALVLQHDVVSARARAVEPADVAPILVRNRAARPRAGVARLRLVDTVAHVPVGPGSEGATTTVSDATTPPQLSRFLTQHLSSQLQYLRRESPQHYPDNDLVGVHDVLAWLPEVPALGLAVFEPALPSTRVGSARLEPPHSATLRDVRDVYTLSNGLADVQVSFDDVVYRVGDRAVRHLLSLESVRDLGDSYTPSLRDEPVALELSDIRRGLAGPLRASVVLFYRHPQVRGIRARVTLALDAGSPVLRIDVQVENLRTNHRLQLHVATGIAAPVVYADAAFGPVLRTPVIASEEARRMETPPDTMPLHRWVCAVGDHAGVTLLSDGLTEAEVRNGRIAVTMVRAIGELSRNDLPERPGHAGWPSAIPDAQSIGRFDARFGVVLHGPWNANTMDAIEHAADNLLLPLVGGTWRDLDGGDRVVHGFELRGTGLRCQACLPAQDGDGIVVRIVNLSEQEASGVLVLPANTLDSCEARLDETPLTGWTPASAELSITLPSRGVTTRRLRARR